MANEVFSDECITVKYYFIELSIEAICERMQLIKLLINRGGSNHRKSGSSIRLTAHYSLIIQLFTVIRPILFHHSSIFTPLQSLFRDICFDSSILIPIVVEKNLNFKQLWSRDSIFHIFQAICINL